MTWTHRLPCLLLFVALCATARPAQAWEPETTHAGLTERAALASALNRRLSDQLGYSLGLLSPLVIPPQDATPLFDLLGRLNPTHGYVPDRRGKLSALGWLAAGSVVADTPVVAARNHFFDPRSGKGLEVSESRPTTTEQRIALALARRYVGKGGVAATDWITAKENPLNLDGFIEQYARAVSSATPAERDRHLAGALVAAGGIVHVLQDMGSPAHVRNDLLAFAQRLSKDRRDIGSRFERIAALSYGRLGVPGPDREIERSSLLGFFTNDQGTGLADIISRSYFSRGTLPQPIDLPLRPGDADRDLNSDLDAAAKRPRPIPEGTLLDLVLARSRPVPLKAEDGTCLAHYSVEGITLRFFANDDCDLDQIGSILPLVSAYSAGLLDYLFRGTLEVAAGKRMTVKNAGADLGKGVLTVYAEDARGVRTAVGEPVSVGSAAGDAVVARLDRLPTGTARVAALFRGVDAAGEPVVAAGIADLSATP